MKIIIEEVNSEKMRITLDTDKDVVSQTWLKKDTDSCQCTDPDFAEQLRECGGYSEEFLDKIYDVLDETFFGLDLFDLMEKR